MASTGSIIDGRSKSGEGLHSSNNNVSIPDHSFHSIQPPYKIKEEGEENDSSKIVVTTRNFQKVDWQGKKWIKFECGRIIDNFIMLQFSGTLVTLEFEGILLPQNLILTLLHCVSLQQVIFSRVKLKGLFECWGKIICPSLHSITFVGHALVKTLTKDEGKIVQFLTDWVILKRNLSLNFLIEKCSPGVCHCTCQPSVHPHGSEILLQFLMVNSAWVKEVRAPCGLEESHDQSCQEVFERINERRGWGEYRNRLLEFLGPIPQNLSKFTNLESIQFSTLDFHGSKSPQSTTFEILGSQKALSTFYYCEVGGSQGTLEILSRVIQANGSTLTSITISIPSPSSGKGISKKRFYPQNLDLKFLEDCQSLQSLFLLCNKRKRLVNTDSIPRRLKYLKIIGAFGFKEMPKLLRVVQLSFLETFEYHNIYYKWKVGKRRKEEEDSLLLMNSIPSDAVRDLFRSQSLRLVILSDKHMNHQEICKNFNSNFNFHVTTSGFPNEYGIRIFRKEREDDKILTLF